MAETLNVNLRSTTPLTAGGGTARDRAGMQSQTRESTRVMMQTRAAISSTLLKGGLVAAGGASAYVAAVAPYSAAISNATATASMQREMALMRGAGKVEGPAAGIIGSYSRVETAAIDAGGSIIRPFLRLVEPLVNVLARMSEVVLRVLGKLGDFLDRVGEPVFKALTEFADDIGTLADMIMQEIGIARVRNDGNAGAWFRRQMAEAAGREDLGAEIGLDAPQTKFEFKGGVSKFGAAVGNFLGKKLFGG